MATIQKKFIRAGMVTALMLAAIWFLRIGLADFMRLEPGTYLDAIRASNASPSQVRLEEVRARLLAAAALDPGNPVVQEYLGQVAFYGAILSLPDANLQQRHLREALESYEAAIALRPNSGYLWASMMLTRQALLDLSRSTSPEGGETRVVEAMRHAAQLAPWEPGIIEQIVWVGTLHYANLSIQDRAIVDGAAARARRLGLKAVSS